MYQHQINFNFAEGPTSCYACCHNIALASYSYNHLGSLVAWVNQVDNPDLAAAFLFINPMFIKIDSGRVHPGTNRYPHAFLTTGEWWSPLMAGNKKKYVSYPSGYYGIPLTVIDQKLIKDNINTYVQSLTGGN